MAIIASIISTFDPRGLNNARKSFAALTDENVSGAKKQQIAMKLLGGAFATAGVAATAFATKLAVQGVRAALEDERSLAMLNKTLSNLGIGFTSGAVDDFINKLQFSTGVADDQLRPALNRLLLATGSLSKAQDLLSLSLDISAGTGKDLESVTAAMSKAALGQFTALQRLGVGLDETILKTKDMNLIQGVLSSKFSGQASVAAQTYAGRLQILKLGADEASEALGYGLLDAGDTVARALGYDAGGLAQALADAGEELGNFTRDVGYTTAGIINLVRELQNSSGATGFFQEWVQNIGTQLLKTNPELEILIRALQILNLLGRETAPAMDPEAFRNLARGQQAMAQMRAEADRKAAEEAEAREKAQQEAEQNAKEALRKHEQALKDLEQQQKRVNKVSEDFAKFVAGTSPKTIQGSLDSAKVSLDKMKTELSGTNKLTDESAEKFQNFASVIQDDLSFAFESAKSQLEEAQRAFDDFKQAISGSILGTLDFASAVENTDFLSGLQKQADTAIKFSERISKLLELGLSETALRQVLDAGAETGTAIADQIIAGGSTVVNKVNELVASVQKVAEEVGISGASKFYSVGITQGQALVDGIKTAILSAAQEIADLASSLGSTTIPPIVIPPSPSAEDKKPKVTEIPPPSQLTKTEKIVKSAGGASSTAASRSYTALAVAMGKIKLADGGIVMGPTNALIGEAGPEAVIPLTGNNAPKIGTTINITVNAGIGTSGAQVGREIVDAIKKFERTSGPVFASA